MKLSNLALAVLLPCLANCQEKPAPRPPAKPRTDLKLSDHPKAAAAAANVRAGLDRDLGAAGLRLGDPIFLRAFKEEMQVELFVRDETTGHYEKFRTYKIAASSGILGPKLAEGDGQVPEGFYAVPLAKLNPDSRYHLSFDIGYPNALDTALGRTGSLIMLHGNAVSIGCLAMTDPKIEEIYTLADAALRNGQPFFRVHIYPFRMTSERLAQAAGNPNEPFWQNLKQGYDLFEANHVPADASVENGRYVFK